MTWAITSSTTTSVAGSVRSGSGTGAGAVAAWWWGSDAGAASTVGPGEPACVADARRGLDRLKEQQKTQARDTTRLEGEAKAKQGEIDKTQAALNQAKSNDEYQALLRSIETKKGELGELETKVLEAYEAQESRTAEQKAIEVKLKQLDGELAEAKKRVAEELAKVDADVGRLEAQRKEATAGLSPDHMALYQRVLETNKDSATAAVIKDNCQGCFMKVRPEQVSQVRGKHLATCETCSRILHLPE